MLSTSTDFPGRVFRSTASAEGPHLGLPLGLPEIPGAWPLQISQKARVLCFGISNKRIICLLQAWTFGFKIWELSGFGRWGAGFSSPFLNQQATPHSYLKTEPFYSLMAESLLRDGHSRCYGQKALKKLVATLQPVCSLKTGRCLMFQPLGTLKGPAEIPPS